MMDLIALWLPIVSLTIPLFFVECYPCGNCHSCTGCSGGQPDRIQVVIQGVVDNVCDNCEVYNATWVLERVLVSDCGIGGAQRTVTDGGGCLWAYQTDATFPCTGVGFDSDEMAVTFYADTATDNLLEVRTCVNITSGGFGWTADMLAQEFSFTVGEDCMAWSARPVVFTGTLLCQPVDDAEVTTL